MLAQDRTRVTNRVRNMPDAHNGSFYAAKLYSKKTLLRLESIRLAGNSNARMLGQHVRHLTDEIAWIERGPESEAAADGNAQLLASMTGEGAFTALLMSVENADMSEFGSPKNLFSLVGLCPAITKSGSN